MPLSDQEKQGLVYLLMNDSPVSDGIFNGYRVGLGALGFSLLEVSSFPWILAQSEHGTHWIDVKGTREFKVCSVSLVLLL